MHTYHTIDVVMVEVVKKMNAQSYIIAFHKLQIFRRLLMHLIWLVNMWKMIENKEKPSNESTNATTCSYDFNMCKGVQN